MIQDIYLQCNANIHGLHFFLYIYFPVALEKRTDSTLAAQNQLDLAFIFSRSEIIKAKKREYERRTN
jgi:hypothetical protein